MNVPLSKVLNGAVVLLVLNADYPNAELVSALEAAGAETVSATNSLELQRALRAFDFSAIVIIGMPPTEILAARPDEATRPPIFLVEEDLSTEEIIEALSYRTYAPH